MATTDNLNLNLFDYTDYADPKGEGGINENWELIDAAVAGKKPLQSAVSNPSANGTAVSFIDSISQNANGVITPTKKTVRTITRGNTGLCPAPPSGTGTTKFLREDASWQNPISKSAVDSALGAGSGSTFYRKDGTWQNPISKSAVDSALGAGSGSTFYRKDGSWANPVSKLEVDTVLGVSISTASAKYFYRKDGQWAEPPSNTWRPYQKKTYTAGSITIEVNGYVNLKASDFGVSTPYFYEPVALVKIDTGSRHIYASFVDVTKTGANTIVTLKNSSSSDRNVTPSITILYVRAGNP